eukprot:6196773-Pleurochrysis_carterae.AAC.1
MACAFHALSHARLRCRLTSPPGGGRPAPWLPLAPKRGRLCPPGAQGFEVDSRGRGHGRAGPQLAAHHGPLVDLCYVGCLAAPLLDRRRSAIAEDVPEVCRAADAPGLAAKLVR